MLFTENYLKRLNYLAGILEEGRKETIVKKIGVPEFVAEWAEELSEKYAIWIADSFKRYLLQSPKLKNQEEFEKELSNKEFPPQLKSFIISEISSVTSNYQHILDWLRGRGEGAVIERDQLDFKTLTFEEALQRSEDWHKELANIQGGKIEDEDGEVFITYPDGFYWIDLGTGYSAEEAKAMGHCGRCSGKGDIFSLRKDGYPYLSGCLNKDDKIITQLRGRANTKPKAGFHPYIISLLKDPKLNVKFFQYDGYQNENNFRFEDLSRNDLIEIIKAKPILLTNQDFDRLDLKDTEIKYLIKNFPSVVPLKTLLKYTDFDELKRNLMSKEYVKNLVTLEKISQLLEMLIEIGGNHKELVAEALYNNPELRKKFFSLETVEGINHSSIVPIKKFIELMSKTGAKGKAYLKNLAVDTNVFEKIYENAPIKFIELLSCGSNLFGLEGPKHAIQLMNNPEFKKNFLEKEKSDEEIYDMTKQFAENIYKSDEESLDENFSIKNNIKNVLN